MKITLTLDGGPRAAILFQTLSTAGTILYIALSNGMAGTDSIEMAVIACYGNLAAFAAAQHR